VLGVISYESGISVAHAPQIIGAWRDYVNAHGGINGHPVETIFENTALQPATAIADAKTLIADHVIAIMNWDPNGAAWGPLAAAAHIPVFDEEGSINAAALTDPNFFTVGPTLQSGVYGQAYAAKAAGAKSLGVFYDTSCTACSQALPSLKAGAQSLGMSFGPVLGFSATAPSYAAQCLAAENAHAAAIDFLGAGNQVIDSCAAQGYKPIWVVSSVTITNSMRADPAFNNSIGSNGAFPWFLNVPQTAAFRAAMKQYLPDFTALQYPAAASLGWSSAIAFQAAAAHVGNTPTSQDIYNGLYSFKNETLGGLVPPVTFVKGKPTIGKCFYVVGIKNGQFVSPDGLTPVCDPTNYPGLG
jgi:branched-chain amino acid transport system substrate-binding protein